MFSACASRCLPFCRAGSEEPFFLTISRHWQRDLAWDFAHDLVTGGQTREFYRWILGFTKSGHLHVFLAGNIFATVCNPGGWHCTGTETRDLVSSSSCFSHPASQSEAALWGLYIGASKSPPCERVCQCNWDPFPFDSEIQMLAYSSGIMFWLWLCVSSNWFSSDRSRLCFSSQCKLYDSVITCWLNVIIHETRMTNSWETFSKLDCMTIITTGISEK